MSSSASNPVRLHRPVRPHADGDSNTLPRLLTLSEVAAALQLSPKTIRRLVARRSLRCIRVGRVLRFSPADLLRFVEARKE